jgi:hypothetical protein
MSSPYRLLTPGAINPKTAKGLALGVYTCVLHLAPHRLSGHNLCASASPGCIVACLNLAGHGGIGIASHAALVASVQERAQHADARSRIRGVSNSVQEARMRRSRLWFADRPRFLEQLVRDIELALTHARRAHLRLAVRLNGTSDVPYELYPVVRKGRLYPHIFAAFPRVQFYDYTKHIKRLRDHASGKRVLPHNYHLTFSLSEVNRAEAAEALSLGFNVAAVWRDRALVEAAMREGYTLEGVRHDVMDGDASDLRYRDAAGRDGRPGAIVGLYVKGAQGKRDASGFVLD